MGNTPSDLKLYTGDHAIKVMLGGKEWTRTVHIIAGDIKVHAELTAAPVTTEPPHKVSGPTGEATVHETSSPTGAEIYIDGKFVGNTPSDLKLSTEDHVIKVTLGGKEWTRTVHIITIEGVEVQREQRK